MAEKFDLTKYPIDNSPKKYILTPEEKDKSKFGKLVFKFPKEENEIVAEGDSPDFVIKPQAFFRGASQIPGSSFNCSFQIFVKPFFLDRMQHVHKTDEYLIFLGASFPDVFDFDAKIELTLGKKGEEAETYVIEEPTIVRFPAGVWHCPLNFKEINKPVLFLAANMMPMFGGVYSLLDDSTMYMQYNGPGQCKYDDSKKCDACGKCLSEKWENEK